MTKTEAIRLLGGTAAKLAEAVGVSPSAVSQWPEELPQRLIDRVQAALWRRAHCEPAVESDAPAASDRREGERRVRENPPEVVKGVPDRRTGERRERVS